ncbi:MAG: HAMP domain-containing sensor histidine kinase [Bacteroidota bacterium]
MKKRYAWKFAAATLPVHALAVVIVIVITRMKMFGSISSFTFFFLLAATGAGCLWSAFYLFNKLVQPLRLAKDGLTNYRANHDMPELPVEYDDEAGLLLNEIQTTITKLDTLITEKSDMIDLLSHDLRSPVGRILSLSGLIKTDEPDQKDLYADYISNECKGLLRLLENILLMLKEDTMTFRLVSVNLKQLISETVSFFDFAVAEKNLNLKVSIDESLYILVQADLFTQAVRNIIGNAIKFSSDGKAILISGRQDVDHIAISIRDEGLGFVPSDIKRLFDRFTGAGKKGTHGETSIGLGLYLSKKIVERHGGKLLAESDGPNKGATFTIILYKLIIKKWQVNPAGSYSEKVAVN